MSNTFGRVNSLHEEWKIVDKFDSAYWSGLDTQVYINNITSFTCTCQDKFRGDRCEIISLDALCANFTCSSYGYCDINAQTYEASCKCYSGYSGVQCEIESQNIKSIKSAITSASIIAILILISFYLLIILLDLSNYFCIE